jgi:amino acid permease
MSHAVVAASGDVLCLPTAGVVASAGMFVVCRVRTMAGLGRSASILSLAALFVVVVQCLVATHQLPLDGGELSSPERRVVAPTDQGMSGRLLSLVVSTTLLKKLSALGSIGFAVGSQKLFLNIRHELRDRKQAPRTLLYGLSAFGSVYILIILLAGADPPSFLFDAIPAGNSRRVAGLLLWAHVLVSYAINSQAICASLERLVSPRLPWLYHRSSATRWMLLTGSMAVAAYTVANAIPFFDDLVALIGAMTSVPLTLLLPVLFWRKQSSYPLWRPSADSLTSYALLAFAVVFMLTATLGSLYSIDRDWQTHGPPFSCH